MSDIALSTATLGTVTLGTMPLNAVPSNTVPSSTVPLNNVPVSSMLSKGASNLDERPRMRLTRRGRIVLRALILVPVLLVMLWGGLQGVQAFGSSDHSTEQLTYITVSQGETLWNIATTVAPGQDPRDVIADIQQLNRLGTAPIRAGEQLALPTYADAALLGANGGGGGN